MLFDNPFPNQQQAALEDIVKNIEIQSNFCINHPNYQPFTIADETVARFQQLPQDIQHKYLSLLLRNFLYGIYYNGYLRTPLALHTNSADIAPHQNLENNTLLGIDLDFYQQLHAKNQGTGYFDANWQVISEESDGSIAVTKGSLTMHIEREIHLKSEEKYASIGSIVAIRMPKNLMQNGFYVAVGNVGQERQGNGDIDSKTGRIYFNLTPDGAIAVMDSMTKYLNAAAIPFTFKVLYNPSEYKRHDCGVLYFERCDSEVVFGVMQTIYLPNRCHFRPEVPLFTKFLAPGLSFAEEPTKKFTSQESFGMNRCQIVANGLMQAWQNGNNTPEERLNAIRQQFSELGIEWERPYLNHD
ncbi:hypothetical protein BJP34_24265 [Moorena producens PAL-8-15-08-1]|uniref:Uncharacterized protein n=1 Tax=Moorena producens PAL-8-15-08-1 TaxID=1458985 RepID=A0A1D8TWW2_9CYAN|nr:T3SS effector HopA1 family protein [Moorena producens]AOX02139.1 hypothetical protein BJP34_24265 [Moorena producens PAL-8-15-08-1]